MAHLKHQYPWNSKEIQHTLNVFKKFLEVSGRLPYLDLTTVSPHLTSWTGSVTLHEATSRKPILLQVNWYTQELSSYSISSTL